MKAVDIEEYDFSIFFYFNIISYKMKLAIIVICLLNVIWSLEYDDSHSEYAEYYKDMVIDTRNPHPELDPNH